jgi:elongation factor 4
MFYTHTDDKTYLLNLIDTPGHVDFNYEVSRSLMACDTALLLVDSSQGVQAQTLANFYLALEQNLHIIPIATKIDLKTSMVENCLDEMQETLSVDPKEVLQISARSGLNCEQIFPALIDKSPHPSGNPQNPLKALIFDSWYDEFHGVICLLQIKDGSVKKGDQIELFHNKKAYTVLGMGILAQFGEKTPTMALYTGQVGYVVCGMKTTKEARIGDTIMSKTNPITDPLPGFKAIKPLVFAGIYPADSSNFDSLLEAMEKLLLTDSSVKVEKESSMALGMGFRCGFLGMLHMEVFCQRLDQEYGAEVIITTPTVTFKVQYHNGDEVFIESPVNFPDDGNKSVKAFFEPIVEATIITPREYVGMIISLCQDRRGVQKHMTTVTSRVILTYILPMSEILKDFHDKVKSISQGYATFEYEEAGFQESDLVKLTIMLNREPVDAMSLIIQREKAQRVGRELAQKLQKVISRQLFEVNIQASVGNKIVASERLAPFRKDVTAKCYGGDQSRKNKLLQKQKEGKKRMKQIGNVVVPQEAFLTLFEND